VRRHDSSGIDAVTAHSEAESPRERVHRLASLGGLVALAGLDRTPPDLLLGILLEVTERLPLLSRHRTRELAQRGGTRLRERNAEKRTWTVHRRAESMHRVELSTRELHIVLRAVGAPTGADPRGLVGSLQAALARVGNAAGESE
jgi:hypothetical protein